MNHSNTLQKFDLKQEKGDKKSEGQVDKRKSKRKKKNLIFGLYSLTRVKIRAFAATGMPRIASLNYKFEVEGRN